MSAKIISTEIVHGKNDQKIIQECHRIRKEVFHLEQARATLAQRQAHDYSRVLEHRDSPSTPNTTKHIAVHFLLRVTEEDPHTGAHTVKAVGTIRGTTPDVYPAINRYKLSRHAP
ncbi:hypothetical protein C8R46DRAFT_1218463 [Mycena filopes]|nr:hypothetical protein C8R46DRAFT_1218463 [Mycena filopes]